MLFIPRTEWDEVLKGAAETVEKEQQTIANIRAGGIIPDWVAMTLAERGCTIVE